MAVVLVLVAQSGQAQGLRADDVVRRALTEGRDLPVIVRFTDDAATARGRRTLATEGLAVGRQHRRLRAFGARVSARALRGLLDDQGTAWVSYDAPVASVQTSALSTIPVSIDASGASVARRNSLVTGAGVRVAVVDSGLQPHPDLPRSRVAAFVDFVNGRTEPYDDYGHGTHVAGIIAGSGVSSDGRFTGAAPQAEIVALRVLDASGAGTTSNVIAALEWVSDNAEAYNIRVVNLSLGHPVFEPAATDPLVMLVEALSRQGVVVVAAAGNRGSDGESGQSVYQSITSPGNAPSAVTVGAEHTNGSLARSDDVIADFSSRGPTAFDREVKPDIVAPGYAVTSLEAPGSYLLLAYPHLEVEPGYLHLSGTSMAAPVVAGAAALVLDANPELAAHTVKALLQFTAQRVPGVDPLTQGSGAVNVAGAVRLAARVDPSRPLNGYWLRGKYLPDAFDELFGETAYWGKETFWGRQSMTGDWAYVHLPNWEDDSPWSQTIRRHKSVRTERSTGQNIVWSTGRNIVWSTGRNIVWSTGQNIV